MVVGGFARILAGGALGIGWLHLNLEPWKCDACDYIQPVIRGPTLPPTSIHRGIIVYPWLWFWAPRIQLPYSGTLSQWVEPNTNWFFDAIQPQAGIGELEKKIFDVASYGRQLGLITEVLLSLTNSDTIEPEKAAESLSRLKNIHGEIEDLKTANESQVVEAAIALLSKLRETDPKQLSKVLEKFQSKDV